MKNRLIIYLSRDLIMINFDKNIQSHLAHKKFILRFKSSKNKS